MKQYFKIKLYRSPLYITVHVILVLISLFSIFYGTGFLLVNLLNGVTLHELFYKTYENSLFFDDVAIIYGTLDFIKYMFGFVFYLFVLILSILSLAGNKIIVYDEYIKIQFAPRWIKNFIGLKNVVDISSIEVADVSLLERVCSFNFSKKYLYKITTNYKTSILISSNDDENIMRLKEIIKTQGED